MNAPAGISASHESIATALVGTEMHIAKYPGCLQGFNKAEYQRKANLNL